eukprot:TRINITY_DN36311_c0_g1_i1.p1 TRINITY_DN36311_c0_g1~~TRINITY_DN36311_c0_g1_i1.p1  ORF type:complete len:122 (-),score=19.64 TRINITY_DN36311_c0_g1_i1:58-390(-)
MSASSSISALYSNSRNVQRVPKSVRKHLRNASYSSTPALFHNSKGIQKMSNCEKGHPNTIMRKMSRYSEYPHILAYCDKNMNTWGRCSQLNMSDWRGNIQGKNKTLSTLV